MFVRSRTWYVGQKLGPWVDEAAGLDFDIKLPVRLPSPFDSSSGLQTLVACAF